MLYRGGLRWVALAAGLLIASSTCAHAAVWRVVYELEGSTLEIRNLPVGDDQAHTVGPGFLTIDFTDNGSTIVDGPVQLRHYTLVQKFTSAAPAAEVRADIFAQANFSGGQTLAAGNLAGGVITWTQTFSYKVVGTNTCVPTEAGGNLICTFAGFTPNQPRDDSREDPVTFAPFRFGAGGAAVLGGSFVADEKELPGNDQADTFLKLRGREIRRTRVEPALADGCVPFPARGAHSGDRNCSGRFELREVLRVVQLYNAGAYHCQAGTEDNFDIGPGSGQCKPHSADYQGGANFRISLSELLRVMQLFSLGAAQPCTGQSSEDGFCG